MKKENEGTIKELSGLWEEECKKTDALSNAVNALKKMLEDKGVQFEQPAKRWEGLEEKVAQLGMSDYENTRILKGLVDDMKKLAYLIEKYDIKDLEDQTQTPEENGKKKHN